jgi:EAL domain-containing protein (putative c-di-GMP-specific phosphodiesterase class I)
VIESEALVSFSQSIRELDGLTKYGYEMLIRGPVGTKLHQAGDLFRAAQHNNLSDLLEISSLKQHLSVIATHTPKYHYTVNIAPRLLLDCRVQELLLAHPYPQQTKIELTEHAQVQQWRPIKSQMMVLRELGYQIWLDDVGCGFFDLELIDKVQPDVVKLCIRIVAQLPESVQIKQDILSVVEAVHSYGGKILAEGVETHTQLQVAQTLGIDYAQGYYFDKPKQVE